MSKHRHTILVVDDEPDVVKSVKDLLRLDYGVLGATSAAEGMDVLRKEEVHVVMTDQRMPLMTGVEFLREVRGEHPDAVRLIFTGYADIRAVIDAINLGNVYRYITKPWDPDELQAIIREACERYDLMVERKQLLAEVQRKNAELEKANADLLHSDVLKSAFIQVASHELRTPLTILNGLTSLARRVPDVDPALADLLRRIEQGGQRMQALVDQIVSMLSSAQFERVLQREPTDVSRLVNDAVDDVRPFIERRGQALALDVPQALGTAEIDGTRIRDTLNHLLLNAIKFTPDAGTITVAASRSAGGKTGGSIRITVSDTGCGIDQDCLPQLFEPFFTGTDVSRHSSGRFEHGRKGIGLGLSVARSFVRMHGGTIIAASEPGKGATFTITLPGQAPAAASDHDSAPSPRKYRGEGARHMTMTRHEQQLRRFPPFAAALVALIGALVLAGWALDVEVLKSLMHPQRVAMNPATALSFILCAIALWMLRDELRDEPTATRRRRAAQLCGAIVALVAASRLIGYALDWESGVDQLLFRPRLAGNVMAPNTAATFFLIGLALLVLDERTRRGFHPAQILVFAAGGVALFSLAGYLYSSMSLVGMRGYIPMALNTAIAFALLCAGLLCARPLREPVRTFVSDTLGGTLARRLVPAALVVPLLFGWLVLRGANLGLYDSEAGLALFVLANIVVFNLLIWWCAHVVHASDTHRRLSQEVLRQNEERHRAVMEQAAEGIYLVDLDTKRILDSNAALERLLGYAHDEAESKTVYDFVDDTRAGVDERLRRLVNARGALYGERRYRRKDGSHIVVEVSATVISYGGRRVACTVVHDITARKQAERELQEKNRLLEEAVRAERAALEKLRESEERNRVVVQQAADGITLVDAQTLRILEVNEAFARLVGYTAQELVGRPIATFIVDTVEGVAARAQKTMDSASPSVVQRQYRRSDGSIVDVEKSATVLTLNGRRVLCTVIHDVTDRNRAERALQEQHRQLEEAHQQLKRAQSQLVQSEKLAGLGQMVAGVAHEINNPLSFVANNVAVLQRDTKALCELLKMYGKADALLKERDGELLASIRELSDRVDLAYTTANLDEILVRSRDGLRRIQQIVKDLRDFARLDESDLHEVDLNAGIESTINIVQGHAKKKRVTIERRLAALPPVTCHPAKVNQVIMNLVGNAIDACPEGGRVTVATALDGDRARIEVSDTGPGVPPDIRQRIFDPFFTTKPPGEGTGLGLSISYGIVKDHGGSIELISAPGEGARFVVALPVNGMRG